MKKTLALLAASGMMLTAFATSSSAANMGEKMTMMMQCSSACSSDYMQCVAAAQQMASTPQEGLSQIKTNFMNSTACGQAAMACQASCN